MKNSTYVSFPKLSTRIILDAFNAFPVLLARDEVVSRMRDARLSFDLDCEYLGSTRSTDSSQIKSRPEVTIENCSLGYRSG